MQIARGIYALRETQSMRLPFPKTYRLARVSRESELLKASAAGLREIHLGHPLPPRPVMASVVPPYIQPMRNVPVAHDFGQAFVLVPAHIVFTGREDVFVLAVAIEVPGITHVSQIMGRVVEVAVVVIVAIEELCDIERATHT